MQISPWLARFPHLCGGNTGLPSHVNIVRVQCHKTSALLPQTHIEHPQRCQFFSSPLPPPLLPVKNAKDLFSLQGALELELADMEAYE